MKKSLKINIFFSRAGVKKFAVLIFFLNSISSVAQNKFIDSLKVVLKTELQDSTKVKTLNTLASKLANVNPDTSIVLSRQALKIAEKISLDKNESIAMKGKIGVGLSLNQLGWYAYIIADYKTGLQDLTRALSIWAEMEKNVDNETEKRMVLNNKLSALANLGTIYSSQGDYPKALDYFFKALKIAEAFNLTSDSLSAKQRKGRMASCFGNIGIVYYQSNKYEKAREYYMKALKIGEELKDVRRIGI